MGYIGEEEEQVRRVYEDPFAEPAPQAPDAVPVTPDAPVPAAVPA